MVAVYGRGAEFGGDEMTQIDRHPLIMQAYEVCIAIEECGASPELTAAVTKASALMMALDRFIPIAADGAEKIEDLP